MSGVLVIFEKGHRMSMETLAAGQQLARQLNTTLSAAAIGDAGEYAGKKLDKLYVLQGGALDAYTPDAFTAAYQQLIKAATPDYVIFPHTYQVRDFAPKLATRFNQVLISDTIGFRVEGGKPVFVRQLFQGKLNSEVRFADGPRFISVQAGAFRAAEPGAQPGIAEPFEVTLNFSDIRSKPEPPYREAQRSVDLNAADMIVSVGRGIKEKENLKVVEDLAEALGAELAASRPICDNGWLPMERQVGSSGQTVSPKVYFAIGISGAIQHLVGIKGSKTIVAINKDENAPIFESADYGAVGDLFEIVPALTEEIKKAKA